MPKTADLSSSVAKTDLMKEIERGLAMYIHWEPLIEEMKIV